MDLLEMPVTLVVKAPNQRIGDQTVECALNWTIKKLKQHLSDAYPSKPKEHQQRLIYSGKLLQDHHTLKEVLRYSYDETQTQHTVHLVCSMTMSDSPKASEKLTSIPQSSPPQATTSVPTTESEGLRHRHVDSQQYATSTPTTPTSYMPQYTQYYSMMQGGVSQAPTSPLPGMSFTPEQMMWYQQMYAHQMAQYMQYMQQCYPQTSIASTSQPNDVAQNVPLVANVQPQQNNNNQQQQQMVMNAAGGQAMFEDEDEDVNRDWLDWSYILCRFAMLVAIIYFYSTLGRFFMVFGFFFLIYLYQAGWFRLNRREPPQQQNQQQEELQNEQQHEEDRASDEDNEDVENNTDDTTAENNNVPAHPGMFRVTLSFFVTFFTSLIPQQPGAVNAN